MIKKIIKILIKKTIVNMSYSKNILINNLDFLIKKITEEFFELFHSFQKYINEKNCLNKYLLIKELCDLLYHISLFIYFNNITFYEIEKEFLRRIKVAGSIEKKYR